MSETHKRVSLALEAVRPEEGLKEVYGAMGRPRIARGNFIRAFLVKALLNIPTTKALVEQLRVDYNLRVICGITGRVPSEASFSRAFAELASSGQMAQVHCRAVRLFLGDSIVEHAAMDSAPISGRERGVTKVERKPKTPAKRGPKKPGEEYTLTAKERQLAQSPSEALAELPKECCNGTKIGPKGYMFYWCGYKVHALIADNGVPLAVWVTSASTHDSMVAIPLLRLGAQRTGAVLYSLADKAYVGDAIARAAEELGQVLIVPKKQKNGVPPPEMEPDRARRYQLRGAVERFFSDLKDNHGGNTVRVRGWSKVFTHLMFGVLAIFGLSILRL